MVEIICEVGKNFVDTIEEESIGVLLRKAKILVDKAKESGANTVKFQIHNFLDEIHPDAKISSPHFGLDRLVWVRRNTYPFEFWFALKEYCREVGINFLSTPMSRGAAEMLDEIGVDRWKIGSGDILDFPMLDYIRDTGKPVILSSGMSNLEELKKAYNYLREKTKDVSILHCVSQYPCPLEKLNLKTITFLKKEFPEAKIGFSDHSIEVSTGLMAIQLGAEIIEKHFTLNRTAWGPDHQVSLEPHEFTQMVTEIRDNQMIKIPKFYLDKALGVETKYIQEDEQKFRKIFHKGLYASGDILQGRLIEPEDIISLRPKGEAEPSENYPQFLYKPAKKNFKKYDILEL